MRKVEPLKLHYIPIVPKTDAEKEEAQRERDRAFNIFFDFILATPDAGEKPEK